MDHGPIAGDDLDPLHPFVFFESRIDGEILIIDGPFRRLAKELKGADAQLQSVDLPVTGSRESNSARVASSEPE